jgi:phosphatidylglycerophosphate synthase
MVSDVLDGYLARRLKSETYFGKVLDLVSDKSMTIVSLLYAAARGISIAPLALIAVREILMIGARLMQHPDGRPLFPTSRLLGGGLGLLLWTNTLLMTLDVYDPNRDTTPVAVVWIAATIVIINLAWRLMSNAARITASLEAGPQSAEDR